MMRWGNWKAWGLGWVCTGAMALSYPSPEALIEQVSDRMLSTLHAQRDTSHHDPTSVKTWVETILLPHVDFHEMSRRVLWPVWRDLTPAQQTDFERVFKNRVVQTYAQAFTQIGPYTLHLLPTPAAQQPQPKYRRVNTRLTWDAGPPLLVNYLLIQHDQGWKVYDFQMEGVGLIHSYRSQLLPAVRQQGFESVYRALEASNQAWLDAQAQDP